jgi:L-2,4-diaminobutyrate decarboxylase
VEGHPGLALYGQPVISTVLFRPQGADDDQVAELRRRLLYEGRAVLGRARAGGRLWLKATVLNPYLRPEDLDALLQLTMEGTTAR